MKKIIIITLSMVFGLSAQSFAKEWKEYKKQHFIIYYNEAPMSFVKTVEEAAEDYYVEITRNLGFTRYQSWTWNERAKIYIYDDKEDYVDGSKAAAWSGGHASFRTKTIRTFPTMSGFFDTTLPHELGHIIFNEFIGHGSQIPIWFHEGVAMYQEKAQRWGADRVVRDAIENGTFMTVTELTNTRLDHHASKETVELFYSESASLVGYLINNFGKHRFYRFCQKLKEGNPFEWALQNVYIRFKSYEDLNKAWVRYLKKK